MSVFNLNSEYGQTYLNRFPALLGGKTYFVCKPDHNNYNMIQDLTDYDGAGEQRLFSTIESAITAANNKIDWSDSPWASQYTIYVFPGVYAENLTALPYGAQLIGLGHDIRDGQIGVKVKPASGSPVNVDSCINCKIVNMGFESADTSAAFDAAICNNVQFENVLFTGAAEATTAVYGFITSDSVKTTFDNCWACNADNGFYFNYTDANDSISYLDMKNCKISGCSATGIYVHASLVGPHSSVRDTLIIGGGQTLAIGIDDNAGVLSLSRCDITATDPVEGCRDANGCYGNGVLLDGTGE